MRVKVRQARVTKSTLPRERLTCFLLMTLDQNKITGDKISWNGSYFSQF